MSASVEKTLRSIAQVTAAHVGNADKAVKRRDQAISEAHKEGLSYGAIAKLTGLSRSRVQQICNAA